MKKNTFYEEEKRRVKCLSIHVDHLLFLKHFDSFEFNQYANKFGNNRTNHRSDRKMKTQRNSYLITSITSIENILCFAKKTKRELLDFFIKHYFK